MQGCSMPLAGYCASKAQGHLPRTGGIVFTRDAGGAPGGKPQYYAKVQHNYLGLINGFSRTSRDFANLFEILPKSGQTLLMPCNT
jgi:hypothetical protein